jgi:hypothetical protein
MTTIVAVVNKFDVFKSTIEHNPFMNTLPIHVYDNTRENITIPQRYNDFIENHMPEDDWVVFCHQDFGFQESIPALVGKLDRNVIYGPIGAAPTKQLVIVIALSRYGVERSRIGIYPRSKLLGQITQSTSRKTRKMGQYLRRPTVVDTLDCCCLIVHSTLIRKYSMRFDNHFDWHLYAEDFSLHARKEHNVLSKAVQFKCVHLSGGSMDLDFDAKLNYLKKKYRTTEFATTCYDGYKRF